MASPMWVVRRARGQRQWRVIELPGRLVATCADRARAQELVDLRLSATAMLDALIPTCEHVPFELLWNLAHALGDDRADGQDALLRVDALAADPPAIGSRPTLDDIAQEVGLPRSRLVGLSKTRYLKAHRDHAVVFNGTIADAFGNRLWWGDVDLTLDEAALVQLAERIGVDLYLYFEGDSRQGFVDKIEPSHAVVHLSNEGDVVLGNRTPLTRDGTGRIVRGEKEPS